MDLITSLHTALRQSTNEGYTTAELTTKAGLPLTHNSILKIRAFLKIEITAGRVEVRQTKRPSIRGFTTTVPAYFPTGTKGKKK